MTFPYDAPAHGYHKNNSSIIIQYSSNNLGSIKQRSRASSVYAGIELPRVFLFYVRRFIVDTQLRESRAQ